MVESTTDKKQEIVAQYVSDMLALEGHIAQALQRQVDQTKDQPDINRALTGYLATTKRHVEQLDQYMEKFGDKKGLLDKAKQGVSSIFGVAAGAIDMVRSHPISKNLRDDYTVGSLAVIGYVMLRTTAIACGDTATATFAQKQMHETVSMLQWIARTIPEVVVRDLEEERDVTLVPGAAQQVINDPDLKVLYGSQPEQTAAAKIS